MIVCDRCGKKIIKVTEKTKRHLTVYHASAAYIGKIADLCDDCQREFDTFIGKAQSYFMVNKDNPNHSFDELKYWDKDL